MPDPVQQAAGSNISFGVAIVAILLFIFGAVLGEHMAEIWGYKLVTRRDYFLANLGWFVGCIFLSSLVWALGWSTLTGFFFGILAGGMAGFKIAFGESIGPWKVLDKYFKVNKAMLLLHLTRRQPNVVMHVSSTNRARLPNQST